MKGPKGKRGCIGSGTTNYKPQTTNGAKRMHDDSPQVILPPPLSPAKAAARLREAEAILAAAGLAGAKADEQSETLLIQLADPGGLVRLQDDGFRGELVARLSALGFPYVALELSADAPGAAEAGSSA